MGGGTSKASKGAIFLLIYLLFNSTNVGCFSADAKKFNQTYMLARELGSGAFSIVKLGIHHVIYFFEPNLFYFHFPYLIGNIKGNWTENSCKNSIQEKTVRRRLCVSSD